MFTDFELNNEYTFSELKSMSTQKLEETVSKFHLLRVPITTKEKLTLYFRKFPSDKIHQITKKAVIDTHLVNPQSAINLNQKNNPVKLLNNKKITYQNPMSLKVVSSKEKFKETTNKILENFPTHRTLLVVNFDKEHSEEFLKSVFSIHGDLRRVFANNFVKQIDNKQRKKVFFNVLVFKDNPSLLHCFDTLQFQALLLEKFTPNFKKMTELEKNELFVEYMRSLDKNLDINQLIK